MNKIDDAVNKVVEGEDDIKLVPKGDEVTSALIGTEIEDAADEAREGINKLRQVFWHSKAGLTLKDNNYAAYQTLDKIMHALHTADNKLAKLL
jgi:hypothetical protein